MIRLTKTDGGKIEEGFTHETNDCGVRALALATGLSYAKAHGLLKAEGRLDRKGTKTTQIERALRVAKIEFAIISTMICDSARGFRIRRLSLDRITRQYCQGRYIVITNTHGMALIDGTIHDNGNIKGPRSQVRQMYKILTPVEPEASKTKEVAWQEIMTTKPEISQSQINELWARLDRIEAQRKAGL